MINPPSSSTATIDHAPSLATDQNLDHQAPSSSLKLPQAHLQQLISATISMINPPSSSTATVDHAPSLATDQNPDHQAPSSSLKLPQAHLQQLISATIDLDQISPSLCLYCVSVYGLSDFPLILWLVYYVLQSCSSGGGGGLLNWVVVACCIGHWIQVKR